ncbi:MAG: hypothetical protein KME29_34020 [Calothrix sp. FI2-JRJ7]|jgi:hypothetical protein|nr:hypothetical protein [Calothrix sp. FI2-JRJ7]
MKKLVVLKFDGAFKSGYRVNLTISNAGETPNLIISAKLPSALAVIEILNLGVILIAASMDNLVFDP